MTVRNLEHLFRPKSVAVVGASPRPLSIGGVVMRNLLAGGFEGPVLPVNPRHSAVAGVMAFPSVNDLPVAPELGVVCTPPEAVPAVIRDLGAKGTKAAVVLTAGLGDIVGPDGRPLTQHMLDAARPNLLRILGHNCVGLIVPGVKLNASFAHVAALPGQIAFVSQSGALCTAVLDWARSRGIGFSHFISLGNGADVDFGDALDYLASEPDTRAIMLYIESIAGARKFMSAMRAAARNKPVVVVKAGRFAEGARAARSHTGAMAGSDDAYDAALRRAGALRVYTIDELFDAVETLAYAQPVAGEALAILTNAGGPGVLATDELVARGGRLARLDETTLARLDAVLPATWSRGNPVDIIGDATPERFLAAIDALKPSSEVEAVLFTTAPTALLDVADLARSVVPPLKGLARPVFASLLGGESMGAARRVFEEGGIPTYDTPEKAIRAFLHLADYRRNQAELMQTPPSVRPGEPPDAAAARAVVAGVLREDRSLLTEPEAKRVLRAYGISTVDTRIAKTPEEAAELAARIGFPVAVKILSPDISHKSDVGGVALDLEDPGAVLGAASSMRSRLAALMPAARLDGFTVQQMERRVGAHEVIAGVAVDATFGPVILFGQGGTAVEVIKDRALALPPLNGALARDLVARTRLSRLLAGYRGRPPARLDAVYSVLVGLSQLVADVPEIVEIDINPLLVDETGAIALDARMGVAPAPRPGTDRFAIRPYPQELEQVIETGGQKLVVRPIRPEDEPAHRDFLAAMNADDIRFRFFNYRREFSAETIARWTQIDYDREMAFIASAVSGKPETFGVARAIVDPDNVRAEFAIAVRSDIKGRGLGRILLSKLIDYLRARGTGEVHGQVLVYNERMLALARRLGFTIKRGAGGEVFDVRLSLDGRPVTGPD
jgi:acetyltransferase